MNILDKILEEIKNFEKINNQKYKKCLEEIKDDKETIKLQSFYHFGVKYGIDEVKRIIENIKEKI